MTNLISFTSLASGSKGNCQALFIGDETILIDCGITFKKLKMLIHVLDRKVDSVSKVFVSHMHGDHLAGTSMLAKYTKAEIIMGSSLDPYLVNSYSTSLNEDLQVIAIPCHHDCSHANNFVVSIGATKFGHITDTGTITREMITQFQGCEFLFIESNYDEELLAKSGYPDSVKERIAGPWGHLSNKQAARAAKVINAPTIAGHLSSNNNTKELVLEAFKEVNLIDVAQQDCLSASIHLPVI